ncbi:IucA/IucC family protein [Thalassospira xiamenensis]|uniref:Siderophore synthetase component n=1 Tax=Thalassospira xiamenensis TaxID=220697 RepID=A0A285RVW4_9PROT|nr:IucA/IucC family protein [Thalassospira xiamenensis]SOB96502.1 Siderophore synthetase component [Thalassospira xiamenensis]
MNNNIPINVTTNNLSSGTSSYSEIEYAQANALRRIVRCLFAERIIDPDRLVCDPDGRSAKVELRASNTTVWFEDIEQAPANTVINHGSIKVRSSDGDWHVISTGAELIDLMLPDFDFVPADTNGENLKRDIANSIENDAEARRFREKWNAELANNIAASGARGLIDYARRQFDTRDASIMLDQWGSLEGHPFYPTWKTKPNLTSAEVASLSPEFAAVVPVRVAALRADMAHLEHMPHITDLHLWFAENLPTVYLDWKNGLMNNGHELRDWLPLPIHGWHLKHYVKSHFCNEINQGILIIDGPDLETRPSMSFRTMLPTDPQNSPFIKLPVAIWLTSELRSLQAKSIHMGPRISTVISEILAAENGFDETLEVFTEDVGIHYKHAIRQDDAEGKLLSVIFRATKGQLDRNDGLLPVTVAALLTRNPSGDAPLIAEMVDGSNGRASKPDVTDFFRRYARAVIHPVIQIYLMYGIALEAHQQNTSILFDENGTPVRMLIRDFGDGRTFAPLLNERGYDLKSYYYKGILPTVFDDDIEPVRSFVIDACFVCHLHEMALTLSHHYELDDDVLWQGMGEETARAFDHAKPRISSTAFWQEEREIFLTHDWSTRSVLRMHLQKYADYRVQHQLPNPMTAGSKPA